MEAGSARQPQIQGTRGGACIPKLSVAWERDAGGVPVPHGGSMALRPGTAARPVLGLPWRLRGHRPLRDARRHV